ncbi:hypothetical protein LTR37_007977 [Vermiconidia calcicola]|uniref:Uncharacterized protein n=1 Tax=Vermiconidia calcicola TaxID=1690605 RepID=A0ACC3NC84_9PEZI|nr:hypothetical protein LTR37_007977 [Vermiconidia calcicola]
MEETLCSAVHESEGRQPPPYSADPDPETILQIQRVVARERRVDPAFIGEAERLRNFLFFTLLVDYQCLGGIKLTGVDRNHFTAVGNRIDDLRIASVSTALTEEENQTLAPYFWRYIHAPCNILGLPVDSVVIAILRFIKYRDRRGRYKGSTHGLLIELGPGILASKIDMDRTIVIPRVISPADQTRRQKLLQKVEVVSRQYFNEIHGATQDTQAYWDWLIMPEETLVSVQQSNPSMSHLDNG